MPTPLPSPPLDSRHGADAVADTAGKTVIPVVAETLEVGVEATQIGAVRVRIEVEQARERVGLEDAFEHYVHTVRPVDRPASERREPYLDGDDVVIPIYEERPVVERRLFLKEEVRLSRTRRIEHREGELPVRRERAVVERLQADGSWRELPVSGGAPLADDTLSSPGPSTLE